MVGQRMNTVKPNTGSELNISDVLAVIEGDPDYTGQAQLSKDQHSAKSVDKAETKTEIPSYTMNMADASVDAKQKAQVKILEQPASKALRFRYECEGRSAGSLPGANSTTENKTYPTIQVLGYKGKAVVVVSCVTKDFPYKPHPHSLVGKEGCKKGVCTLEINNENMICTFSNLGVQCVKKKGIEEALKLREEIRVDPFHTGFAHKNQPQSIDLNAVRLCFQVFLEGQKGKFTLALKPVVSEAIYDKKAMCELTICKLSDCSSPVSGGKEIILLCDKVTKDDIQVVFYHEEEGRLIWEGIGDFSASDVHKQVAITFRTPRYRVTDVEEPISLYVQLRRPSDGACSESRRFEYLPLDSDAEMLKRKRQRLFESNSSRLKDFLLDNVLETHEAGNLRGYSPNITVESLRKEAGGAIPRPIKQITRTSVKREPADPTPTESQADGQGYSFEPNYNQQFTLNIPNLSFGTGNPSPTASPNPPYHNYEYRFPTSPHYNIPVHSPNHGAAEDYMNQMRTVNITDLDSLNMQYPHQQPQQANEQNEFRAINLPLSDCNIQLIDSHLLSNLSLHDGDSNDQKDGDRNESMSTSNIAPELPVLTFSGMLTSADLDGPDGFGRGNPAS
ncbi:proto-oncogene c-Rel isoform X2 [Daphnia magna]|uniref:proto-oncogene c-Rel isoform X2 n=1 Tax=Daphnia magna TaxID=35525 RepID=UPI001E1BCAA7|nr:proto-oncogene c-Rel isoform X2 [Daphnia magna]